MKWVARKMKEDDWRSFSQIAQQMLAPSSTDVPLPSSSIMIREVGPRLDRMNEVSCISTMKVDEFDSMQSLLDTLEKILSGILNVTNCAGRNSLSEP